MSSNSHERRPSLAVEELESREVPTVAVRPGFINLRSIDRSHGAFHIRVVSDTTDGANLLKSGSPLVITLKDHNLKIITLGSPARSLSRDVNNDGITDQGFKFRRSALSGLADGEVTVQVTAGAAQEQGKFVIFLPGAGRHRFGQHPHGLGRFNLLGNGPGNGPFRFPGMQFPGLNVTGFNGGRFGRGG